MLFAANRPERVSALIILNSYARLLADDDYPFGVPVDEAEEYVRQFGEGWGTTGREWGTFLDAVSRAVATEPTPDHVATVLAEMLDHR